VDETPKSEPTLISARHVTSLYVSHMVRYILPIRSWPVIQRPTGARAIHPMPSIGLPLDSILILLSISIVFSAAVLLLFHKLKTAAPGEGRLNFPVEAFGGFSYRQLVLISVLSLFMEMLMIRWVSSEIGVFAYLKNFVLVACFLGFGLGCYLCRRRVQLSAMILPLLLLVLILKSPLPLMRLSLMRLPRLLGAGAEVHVWGVPALPASWTGMGIAILFIAPLFALIAIGFVPFGQFVGWYLENAPHGVTAYSVNVVASLAGIAGYTLLCFFDRPPWAWFLVAGILSLAVLWPLRAARGLVGVAFIVIVAVAAMPDYPNARTYWSPYQKLILGPVEKNGQIESYFLTTNGYFYQRIVNLSDTFVRSHPDYFRSEPIEWNSYNLPYRFYPSPAAVLVLGAGMGNDVSAALRNGAGRVVAVEIDPLILRLGRELHFEHPYQSPRTQVVIDDARAYIENSHDQFDLIVFSLLDSHTTTSHFTNIRTDNYVYTQEALRRARGLLRPNGLLVLKFQVDNQWLAGRFFALMKDTFGHDPIQFQSDVGSYDVSGRFFVEGSHERLLQAMSNPALAAYVSTHSNVRIQTATLTTDDWPYLYQHEPGLPMIVILVSLAVLIIFGWFLRETGGLGQVQPHFLFLGAGFMLLEAQIVSKMALLFGTTWLVNSIAVSGLLCLIVAANLVFSWFPRTPVALAYAGLFLSLTVMFAVPLQQLFFESRFERLIAASFALCTPVFFAGLVFVSSFAGARFQSTALGSNLFGSLVGGLLESLSLWFGLRSLTLIAALLFIGSAIWLRRKGRTEGVLSASGSSADTMTLSGLAGPGRG